LGGLGAVLAKPFRLDVLGARVGELLRSYGGAPRLAKREPGRQSAPTGDVIA